VGRLVCFEVEGMMDFTRALALLHGFFEEQHVRWALIGGLALAAYGLPRTTFDLDVVADGDRQDDVIAFLAGAGFETLYRSRGFSNHLHGDRALGRIDVVYVRGDTRDAIFRDARSLPGPGGMELFVPRPEHLAAMKVAAMSSDPGRTFGDLADVRFLLDLPGVNRGAIRAAFAKYGLLERYLEIEKTL
jgi:hypothetical protein